MTYGTKSTENRRKKHIRPGNDLWIGKLGLTNGIVIVKALCWLNTFGTGD